MPGMQACTVTQLTTGLVLVALFSFGGCAEKQPPPAAAPPPATTTAETPTAAGGDDTGGDDTGGDDTGGDETGGDDTGGDAETRTTEVIRQVVLANRKPFRDCYEKRKKDLPTLTGTMTLHFTLDPEGKVKSAELNQERSDLKSPTVVNCALAELKKLKFPASSRGMETTVNYPFDFKS